MSPNGLPRRSAASLPYVQKRLNYMGQVKPIVQRASQTTDLKSSDDLASSWALHSSDYGMRLWSAQASLRLVQRQLAAGCKK